VGIEVLARGDNLNFSFGNDGEMIWEDREEGE
jgi:hypothetical protein